MSWPKGVGKSMFLSIALQPLPTYAIGYHLHHYSSNLRNYFLKYAIHSFSASLSLQIEITILVFVILLSRHMGSLSFYEKLDTPTQNKIFFRKTFGKYSRPE